jgi:hypothetical protein
MTLEAKVYELVDFLHRIDPIVFIEHISAKLKTPGVRSPWRLIFAGPRCETCFILESS